jgi:hypothetical protein
MAEIAIKSRKDELTLKGESFFCGAKFPASLKLGSEITSDITERLFKRGIAANS